MISAGMVQEIRRLLAEGRLSQRKISKATGVSRATISAIASGTRPDYEERRQADLDDRPQGPPRRCPGCGGLVYLPCRLCKVRAWKWADQERRRNRASAFPDPHPGKLRAASAPSPPSRLPGRQD